MSSEQGKKGGTGSPTLKTHARDTKCNLNLHNIFVAIFSRLLSARSFSTQMMVYFHFDSNTDGKKQRWTGMEVNPYCNAILRHDVTPIRCNTINCHHVEATCNSLSRFLRTLCHAIKCHVTQFFVILLRLLLL